MYKGLFVVLEGIDGSGKTSVAFLLKNMLSKRNIKTVVTREPTYFEAGKLLRTYLSHYSLNQRDPIYEALLFAADRIYHVNSYIKPLLKRGYVVVSDRYLYSSVVYQGTDGLPEDWILSINKFALKPDLAFFINVSPQEAIKRLSKSTKSMFENIVFLNKVYNKYIGLVERGLLININGIQPINRVATEIYNMVISKWREKNVT